jgi:hypothetical protein
MSSKQCSICLESLDVKTATWTPCIHCFHPECLNTWLESKKYELVISCPICKFDISALLGPRDMSQIFFDADGNGLGNTTMSGGIPISNDMPIIPNNPQSFTDEIKNFITTMTPENKSATVTRNYIPSGESTGVLITNIAIPQNNGTIIARTFSQAAAIIRGNRGNSTSSATSESKVIVPAQPSNLIPEFKSNVDLKVSDDGSSSSVSARRSAVISLSSLSQLISVINGNAEYPLYKLIEKIKNKLNGIV